MRFIYLLLAVILLEGLIFNLYPNLPRLPGDINIDKPGFRIYIPFISAIIISVLLIILLNFFKV
ncbi:MAG: DUF2905 family protein [Candidatus Daviesbacteria bacterium]